MRIIMLRSIILYALVIFAVRLMGKRQLGELQPSELVITILVSNIATLPVEDTNIPLLVGVTPILSLVCFEVILSSLDLKLPGLRKLVSGSPKIIIRHGQVDVRTLKELRFSVDDLMMALRGQDIFDISEVEFAVVETTGSVSVLKKPEADPPQVVVADGVYSAAAADSLGISEKDILSAAKKCSSSLKDIFIMTADGSGSFCIVPKGSGKIMILGGSEDDKT